MQSRIFARILIAVVVATSLLGVPNPAGAISSADWQAGRIIDDTVFNYANDMGVDQIQAFLNSKVPTCDTMGTQPSEFGGGTRAQYGTAHGFPPPYVCLKDYYENETTHENNLQGRAIPAGAVSAARMIYDAAQASSVNPKVLIVTLQKESSGPLVTDTWPFYTQYRTPMGYACPDTAPCDSQYYGFYNQMSNAAAQFRRYANNPANYRYKAKQNNSILYNPSTSCGSSTVFITNQATANLYNYTPYQPNPAALANMSDSSAGGSATCGAYGNRNFFWYYNKWFGSTRRDLVQSGGGAYLIDNGAKRAFPNEITFLSYGYRWADVLAISAGELAQFPDGAAISYNTHFREGRLVSTPNQGVYLVDNGLKRPIVSALAFASYSYPWSEVLSITPLELSLIPDGASIGYNIHYRDGRLIAAPNQGVYLVDNGLKRPIVSALAFESNGYKWASVLSVTSDEPSLIPDGTSISYNVHYRDGKLLSTPNQGVYLIDNGTKRPIVSALAFESNGYKWASITTTTPDELQLIPDGSSSVGYNVHYRDGRLVAASGGGVYLVDNGAKRAFADQETFLSYGYKWTDILMISSAEISLIPDGTAMPPKS